MMVIMNGDNIAIEKYRGTNLLLKGDRAFISRSSYALDLLRSHYPIGFQTVLNHVTAIEQADRSGICLGADATFYVGNPTSTAHPTWYASCILHDAYHRKLFDDATKSGASSQAAHSSASGAQAEMKCLDEQIKSLRAMNAPAYILQHAEHCKSLRWWEVKNRNW